MKLRKGGNGTTSHEIIAGAGGYYKHIKRLGGKGGNWKEERTDRRNGGSTRRRKQGCKQGRRQGRNQERNQGSQEARKEGTKK